MRLARVIYRIDVLTKKIIRDTLKISTIVSLLSTIVIFYNTGNYWQSALGTIAVFIAAFLFSKGLRLIMNGLIPPGGTSNVDDEVDDNDEDKAKHVKLPGMAELDLPFKFFVKSKAKRPCTLNLKDIEEERFEFANKATSELAAEMNVKAFARGLWAGTKDEKLERNTAHIEKNAFSIMFVKSKTDSSKYLGYTHILPVTRLTWDKYTSGDIGDNEFHDGYVVDTHAQDEKPYGLIVFSVASVRYDSHLKNPIGEFRGKLGSLYEQAVVYHISKLLQITFVGSEKVIQVLIQNDGKKYLESFSGCCTSNNKYTKDNTRLIVMEIKKP